MKRKSRGMWVTTINSRLPLLAITAALVTACSTIHTIHPQVELPAQTLGIVAPPGHARVIFFNSSNWVLFGLDGSGKLNIFLADKNLASLEIGTYVQLMLPHGEYDVTIAHLDIATFTSAHILAVTGEEVFVEVFAKTTSNGLEVVEELPADFAEDYRPALAGRGN